MEVHISNQIVVYGPTDEVMKWAKKELVLPNPDYQKKLRMGFWVGDTPPNVYLYETKNGDLYLPYGMMNRLPARLFGNARFVPEFKPGVRVDYQAEVPLYDYQEEAVQQMMNAKMGILQSPAGSGKTQMGIALAIRYGRKCLWLCHTKDLINQSKERAERYIDKSLIGTITEGQVNIGKGITFATIQTMANLDLPRYKDEWDVIITDEVHRVSGSPTSVTRYEKVLNNLSARHKFGLSATVHRADGMIKATYALVGNVSYIVPDEAVEEKIMKVGILPVGTGTPITSQCLFADGTLCYSKMINYLAADQDRSQVIVDCIAENKGHSCLILSDRLEHLKDLKSMLPLELRAEAVMISGKQTSKKGKAEREKALNDMRTGRKKYLFATYSLAKEGLDIPRLDRLFLTTPQKDYAVITQSIGRVARRSPGKTDAICYDFVDNFGYAAKAYKRRWTTYRKDGCYEVTAE